VRQIHIRREKAPLPRRRGRSSCARPRAWDERGYIRTRADCVGFPTALCRASPATRPRALARPRLDDVESWIVLGCAAAIAGLLILVETRSNTFFNDEIAVFQRLGEGVDVESMLEPHGRHLILPAHLLYAAIFSWVGPSYTAFRVLGVLVLLACVVLFYVLAKRRAGATGALVSAIVLLFLGSAWEALLWPFTMLTSGLSVAFGLGALVALDRDDARGDVAACALTALAVASHSTGLAFLVGVAVAVLIRGRNRQRAWVFAVPLAIYAAWWVWALRFHEGIAHLGNLLIVPKFMADSLAAVSAAVTGLGLDLGPGPVSLTLVPAWGYVIAPIAAVAFAIRLSRGRVPPFVWIALAILVAYWLELALAFEPEGRTPTESRYLFPGAVLVLLVAGAALERVRISRTAAVVIIGVGVVGVLTNIKQLDNAERFFSDYAPRARAALGAIEIAYGSVSPAYRPAAQRGLGESVLAHFPAQAGPYLEAVDRFGSYAFSGAELLQQDAALRESADRVLASAERLALRPAGGGTVGRCEELSGGGGAVRELPAGRVSLVAGEPVEVRLGRFAVGYPVDLGRVRPRAPVALSIPRDAEARPWRIEVRGGARTRICHSPSS
jgi:hypothetical protein